MNVIKDIGRSFTGNSISKILGYFLAFLIVLTVLSIIFS
ncbi:conserved hypothetical protein [Methanocaldococcus infernus ME]|uniref:Uncharacterized protein n=1 Tax=Methanocaldococcus infernus (strain DSM 11812 / JCM 15783 / ME) TaxID=573063 RepID=D5VSL1_METIM|nr:conserved hypothetical protein [Methanocaldococcus infernus ME]